MLPIEYLKGETPLISDEFKARLKAHVVDAYEVESLLFFIRIPLRLFYTRVIVKGMDFVLRPDVINY